MAIPTLTDPRQIAIVASALVHADELINDEGVVPKTAAGEYDLNALRTALDDAAVQAWVQEVQSIALAPLKRKDERRGETKY